MTSFFRAAAAAISFLIFLAACGSGATDRDFSFIVFGDTRLPGYLPYNDAASVQQFFEQVGSYAGGPCVTVTTAPSFDPVTRQVTQVEIDTQIVKAAPCHGTPAKTIMDVSNGWPDKLQRQDEATGMWIQLLRADGQKWVYEQVVEEIGRGAQRPEGPAFALHTGDVTYSGYQGTQRDVSPYWRDFNERLLSQLPPGAPDGLPARFFPALGNHETWLDPDIEGVLSTMPYLTGAPLDFSRTNRIYKFDYRGSRFIFLDTGDMHPDDPARVHSQYPAWERQMEMLAAWLAEARKSGLNRAFITFHNPAFATTGAGAIPADQNPHRLIAQFAADLDIIVFNGHVHTTELFEKDGVRYLLLGNGGGEQDYSPCEPPRNCTSRDDELYWKSENRVEEYNYLVVTVSQGGVQMKLRRYRPEAATPFETVELFR